jgi:hypothetical protein
MVEALVFVGTVAIIAMVAVPAAMLILASVGLFEPMEFVFLGREYRFAPKTITSATTPTNVATTSYSPLASYVGASAYAGMSAVVMTVVVQLQFEPSPVTYSQVDPQTVKTILVGTNIKELKLTL